MQNLKYEFTTPEKLRHDLKKALAERGVSLRQLSSESSISPTSVRNFLCGVVRYPCPATLCKYVAWLNNGPIPQTDNAPEMTSVEAPLPPSPPAKAIAAWLELQRAFLFMHITPTALFDKSVRELNAYFSGTEEEGDKNA